MHLDRYLFQYFAYAYTDHKNHYLELPAHKAPVHLMGDIYNWLINDKNELIFDGNFVSTYALVKYLDVRRVLEQYYYNFVISDKYGIQEQDAFMAYLTARQMPCNDLIAILLSKVRKCFLPLVASSEFLGMNAKEVIFLFYQDTLCVNSEDEVFFAAVRWLEHDWTKRQKYLAQVMAAIRMRLLSPWLQWSIIYKPENKVIRKLGSNDRVRAMLWDACLFGEASVNHKKPSDNSENAVNRKYNQANEVQRFWVYFRGIAHHHDLNCPLYRKLTYRNFKLFLIRLHTSSQKFINAIQEVPLKHWNTFECCKYNHMQHPKFLNRPIPSIYNIYDL